MSHARSAYGSIVILKASLGCRSNKASTHRNLPSNQNLLLILTPISHFPATNLSRQGMGLWTLLEGFLLLANALAVLNEDRFLSPRGWGFSEVSGGAPKSIKGQIIGFIYATQFLRVPLILLNAIFIIVKLVSG